MYHKKILLILVATNSLSTSISSADDSLSYQQKVQAIESLRAFEDKKTAKDTEPNIQDLSNSSINEIAINAAQPSSDSVVKEQNSQKKVVQAFKCETKSEHNCELQRYMYRLENNQDEQQKVFVSNGKYKVRLFFNNDNFFPKKYSEKNSFESIPENGRDELENRIFEHYLGYEYAEYHPELINVYDHVVGIAIDVSSSDELNRFLDDGRIQGIHHIGNDSEELDEGYH